jgi:hypothetical protein
MIAAKAISPPSRKDPTQRLEQVSRSELRSIDERAISTATI